MGAAGVLTMFQGYDLSEAMVALEGYDPVLSVAGLAALATTVLPRLLLDKPLSMPMGGARAGIPRRPLPLELEVPTR